MDSDFSSELQYTGRTHFIHSALGCQRPVQFLGQSSQENINKCKKAVVVSLRREKNSQENHNQELIGTSAF